VYALAQHEGDHRREADQTDDDHGYKQHAHHPSRGHGWQAPVRFFRLRLDREWLLLGGRRRKIIGEDAKGKPICGKVANGSDAARAAAVRAAQERAEGRAADLAPTIKALQAAGATSLRAIAAGLNDQGIPTARGEGEWTATQVMRVLERLDPFEAAA